MKGEERKAKGEHADQAFARRYPARIAGLVLVDASSPIKLEGVFVSTQPPAPGTTAAWEAAGIAPSVAVLKGTLKDGHPGHFSRREAYMRFPHRFMFSR